MKFENYIWDFDGTLFDTYEFLTSSLQKALLKNGAEVSYDDIYARLRQTAVVTIKYYSQKFGIEEQKLLDDHLYYSHQFDYEKLKPFPYIIDVLNKVINSGGKNYIYTHRGQSIYPMLEYYGLTNNFVEVVESSSKQFKRKPDPYSLEYLTSKYQMNKEKTIYIGDREIDIECANLAKIKSCFYDTDVVCENATFCVKSFKEFLDNYCK